MFLKRRHSRYGHLREKSPRKLAKKDLVQKSDYNVAGNICFCETCIGGKHHRTQFETSKRCTQEPLELVYSDVCGKM